jgi:hypothetical protein
MRWLLFWRPPCLLRACLVNLKDDPHSAIKGVLWSTRGPWLTFKDCALIKADAPLMPLDGDVIVHRSNLAFLQVLP